MAQFNGSNSADAFAGTSGADTFAGFGGNDTFVFDGRGTGATDVILDFGATYFTATITGAQEVPPVSSSATGTFSGQLLRSQAEFNFSATVTGLDFGGQTPSTADNVTAAHFHRASPGVAGGVVWGFIGTPNNDLQGETVVNAAAGTVTGSWDANEGNGTTLTAMVTPLLGGDLYINFHTTTNPGGEIRGQVLPIDSGADRIDVSVLGVGDYTSLLQVMSESGGSTRITTNWNGQANTLVLQGVPLAKLSGSDFIYSTLANGQRLGTDNADDLFGGSGSDALYGMGGNDRIFAGAGADAADGGDGADTILGLDGNDTVNGGRGDDNLNGNQGDDVVNGDDGVDIVRGGQGNDTISGGAGNDVELGGNRGSDVIHGNEGNDTIYGGREADTLYGDAGDDRLSGDIGNDILYGGAGADRFVLRAGTGTDWVGDFDFASGDRIELAAGTTFVTGSYQGQALIGLSTGDTIGLAGVAATSFNANWIVFV